MRIAVACVIALVACKGGSKDKPAEVPAGSGVAPVSAPVAGGELAKVAVTVGGKPVVMQRAFVKRMDPDRYQLYLSSEGGSCQELLDNTFESRGRIDVLASVSPRLDQDGKQFLEVTDVFEGAPTMVIAPGGKIAIRGDAMKDTKVEVDLDLSAASADKAVAITARGSFVAEGCGARPTDPSGIPRASHPTSATLTIANQRLELKGAILKPGTGKERDLLLSTAPKDCSPSTPWAAVVVERERGTWKLAGTWLRTPVSADGTPALAVKPGATGTSDDGATVKLALSGTATIGGYTVVLDGELEAIDCR